MSRWLAGLNPEQAEAAQHTQGPLLILAGAGSGKTTVLVSRTGNLIETKAAKASELAVLTFTNKAARELKHRVVHKLGASAAGIWAGTFHSFGLRLLREFHKQAGLPFGFGVLDAGDSISIIKELTRGIHNASKDTFKAEKLMAVINDWRSPGRSLAGIQESEYHEMAEVILPKYLRKLKDLGVVDFETLLLQPLELIRNDVHVRAAVLNRYTHLMVDEFQDTNDVQYQLLKELAAPHQNLGVVGDDDQSIYGWRGAEIKNILDFPKQFAGCKVVRLERNYRSTPAILNLANQVIQKNRHRHGKVLKPDPRAEQGDLPELFIYENDALEAEEVVRHIRYFTDMDIKLGEIAILYRSNGQGALLESQLRANRIEYEITGGSGFFDRKETKDIMAYLRCAIHPHEVAFRRILQAPPRGVGETSIDRIAEYAAHRKMGFHVAARGWRQAGVPERAGAALEALFKMLDGLPERLTGGGATQPGEVLLEVLNEIGFRDYIRSSSGNDEAFQKRWNIVQIFCRVLNSFYEKGRNPDRVLHEFLDSMELRDHHDEDEEENNRVQLLTLHAAKGLEFDAVVLIGVEEDLLPHKTLGSDIDEERRLFYVGVTRARKRLILTRAKSRQRYGRYQPVTPSRFLLEVPAASFTEFPSGYRPVSGEVREDMLAKLMNQLNSQILTQKIDK